MPSTDAPPCRLMFQSTHPRGVRRALGTSCGGPCTCFNPRTRVGCDIFFIRRTAIIVSFNPRTRVGCDISVVFGPTACCWFQSTHPRGVRPHGLLVGGQQLDVSIHAPAWGATSAKEDTHELRQGFNPRTRVGCDVFPQFMGYGALQFQSTHPRGVRLGVDMLSIYVISVSIHAPAWGATKFNRKDISVTMVSIHAPAWGATSFC